MTTTFTSREVVRDQLVTRFTSAGNWQAVYGYMPPIDDWVGRSPILMIRSRGSSQDFAGDIHNPVRYRFLLSSWTLATSDDVVIDSQEAEDIIDDLDLVVRQTLRNYAGGDGVADQFYFEAGFSDVRDVIISGKSYIVETWPVIAELFSGAL